MNRIPPRNQSVDYREWVNLHTVATSEIYTHGAFSKEFEKRLAEFVGARYCLLCNSGSSANLLAMSALTAVELGDKRLKPGDEVITTALNFPTTVNPIIQCGLVPVFVDIELPYYVAVDRGHTQSVVITNFLGNRASTFGMGWIVIDNCDSLGTSKRGGDIDTFSFYPAHTITTGEGGAVCTDDPLLYKLMRSFRDWGRDCYCEPGQNNACGHRFDGDYDHKYTYSHIGYNLQMTEMQAALGVAQMDKLPGFIKARKANFKRYYDGLKDLEDIFILPQATPGSDPAWFGFPLTFRDGRDCNSFCQMLDSKGVEVRRMMAGNIIKQPAYKDIKYRIIGDLKNTDFVMKAGFWIFVSPTLTDEMMEFVIDVIHEGVKWETTMHRVLRENMGAWKKLAKE
jgi:CDP-6-deoxy-D-xylo-4-hexulose-3-dehydrase